MDFIQFQLNSLFFFFSKAMLKKCKNYLSSLDIQKQVVVIVCHSLKTDLQLIPVFSPMFPSQLWVQF